MLHGKLALLVLQGKFNYNGQGQIQELRLGGAGLYSSINVIVG